MKVDLIKIGNSRGIRIPKILIEECGLGDRVDLTVKGKRIVVAADRRPRQGWAEAFQRAAKRKDDALLMGDTMANEFDREEWTW